MFNAKTFSATAKPGNYFWSDGHAWGNATVNNNKLTIAVHYGKPYIQTLQLNNGFILKFKKPITIEENNSEEFDFSNQ